MGGPSRVISLWADFFTLKGFQVEIVSNIDSEIFYKTNSRVIYTVLGIDEFKQQNKIKTFYKLYRFMRERKSELIIFNKGSYITYIFLLKFFRLFDQSIKTIYFSHGGSSNFKVISSNLHNYMIAKTFDYIFSLHNDYDNYQAKIEKSIKRKVIDYLVPHYFKKIQNKLIYIGNPVSFRTSRISNYKNNKILAIGRFDPVKGFDLLIKAWGLISKKYPNWSLNIVGEGNEESNLIKLIKSLDIESQVKVLPRTDNVKSYYLQSSIYAMSSIKEGLGMVLLEAMECGLPIVAFKSVGAKHLVSNKKNGFLINVANVESFAKKIEFLILNENLRREFGINSKILARKFYIENIYKAWEPIMSKLKSI